VQPGGEFGFILTFQAGNNSQKNKAAGNGLGYGLRLVIGRDLLQKLTGSTLLFRLVPDPQ
jgi:hypothetical protein